VGAVLIAAAVALVTLQRRALTDNLETTVDLRSRDIAALLSQGASVSAASSGDDDVDFVQVVDAGGTVISSSSNVAGFPAMFDSRRAPGDSEISRHGDLPIDDDEFLVVARGVTTPGGDRTVYVGGNLEEIAETTESLVGLLRVGIPLLLAGLAVGTWFLVGRALAPMERIRDEVATMTGDNLGRRVPEPRSRDEVGRLARTMNEMLDRVEGAYDRQQRFVADASHELRSPLATLQAQLEVTQSDPDARDWPATSVAMTREVERMQRLVDQLLFLARTDQDRTPEVRPVDLDDIVLEEARALAGRTNTRIDVSAVSAGQVLGDGEQLRRAVRNLLDNAIRHARTTVSVILRETPERVELTVIDDGPGIPPEARERIFERFTRLDSGRSADRGGAGLGLAITRAIADAHHGTITLDPTHTAGTRFVLRLPSAAAGTEAHHQ
jgi:signal transduction histidine kinase